MAVQQTECYRVVTIGYLKTFIGDLIQDSSNGSVIHISRTDDTYCPTYSELTGGTIIQTWKPGDTPNGDRDGITVNSSAILGGNYAANQLVDQRDLSLMYTRINTFSIAASPTSVTACANESIISYTHTYNRNSKYMNSSCAITSGGNTAVTDTNDSEVELTANYSSIFDGWSNHTKKLNIPKNSSSTGEAPERYITVNGAIVFRGSTGTSTVTITQGELTASWEYVSTSYDISAWRVYPSDGFRGCTGDLSYSATGEGYTYTTYIWKDSCGDTYQPKTETSTTSLGTSGGSFGELDCCDGDQTNEAVIPFNFNGKSTSVNFVQSCSSCASDPGCSPTPPPDPPHDPDKWRGTDNGSDYIDGVWYSHPLNIWFKSGSNDDDTICVSTLYYRGLVGGDSGSTKIEFENGSHTSLSTAIQVNDWLRIYWDPSPNEYCSYGWVKLYLEANTTSSPRSVTFIFSTDDTGNLQYGKYAGKPVASEWQYEVKQAPYNHYWYGTHSYNTEPVQCCTGPCPESTIEEGCYGVEACDCSGPTPPDTGVCTNMVVSMNYDTGVTCDSSGNEYVNFRIRNYNSNCGRMYMQMETTDSVRTQVTNFYIDHDGEYSIKLDIKLQGTIAKVLIAWLAQPEQWSYIDEVAVPDC